MPRVDIEISGNDKSDIAFRNVASNAKKLTNEMKGLGGTARATGDVLAAFGNTQLASVVDRLGTGVLQARQFAGEIGKSKSAVVGLGAATFAAAYEMGDLLRQWIPFVNFHDKMERSIDKAHELIRLQNELISLNDPQAGSRASALASIDQRIEANRRAQETLKASLGRAGIGPGVDDIGAGLQKIRNATSEKFDKQEDERIAANRAKYTEYYDFLFLKIQDLGNEEVAEFKRAESVDLQRQQKIKEMFDQKIISEQQFNALSLLNNDLYEKEKTRISEEQAKKRKEILDDERRKQLQNYAMGFQAAGSFFGGLAQLSEAFGKKNFKLTQAFRYAEAIMNTASAVTNALATIAPWPIPLIFAAAAAAAGAAQIAIISSAKPPGQAHGGIESVPEDATYELRQGERVLKPKQNVQLQEFLDRAGGGLVSVEVYLDSRVILSTVSEASADGRLRIDARSLR